MKTKVIFRTFRQGGDTCAFFPRAARGPLPVALHELRAFRAARRRTWEASKQSAHLLTLSPSARPLAEIRPQVVRPYQPAVIKKG